MKTEFPDGSFMLSWDRCRAWYDKEGKLKDAEYKRKYRGYPTAVSVSPCHIHVLEWLEMQGEMEADFIKRSRP